MDTHQQLLANIATIIEYLKRVPGVVSVEVTDAGGEYDYFEKKVFVTFAGCDEQVLLEIY
jgi:hypothetical protein